MKNTIEMAIKVCAQRVVAHKGAGGMEAATLSHEAAQFAQAALNLTHALRVLEDARAMALQNQGAAIV